VTELTAAAVGILEAGSAGGEAAGARPEIGGDDAIAALRRQAEAIRVAELRRAKLRGLGPEERRAVEALTAQIVDELLRVPAQRAAAAEEHARRLHELFASDAAA